MTESARAKAISEAEPASNSQRDKPRIQRKGRPKNKRVENRRETIARIAATGKRGENYIQAINAARLPTPIEWQEDEKCPKSYVEAYNHADLKERKKWRKLIWNEKTKAVKAHAKNSTRQKS